MLSANVITTRNLHFDEICREIWYPLQILLITKVKLYKLSYVFFNGILFTAAEHVDPVGEGCCRHQQGEEASSDYDC